MSLDTNREMAMLLTGGCNNSHMIHLSPFD